MRYSAGLGENKVSAKPATALYSKEVIKTRGTGTPIRCLPPADPRDEK